MRLHAPVMEGRVLIVLTAWCELLGSAHLILVECRELLRGDHLELAVGSDSVSDVRHTVRGLHSHGIESGMQIHRWITIRRKWRLPVPHHLRVHVRRALHSSARRGTIKTLIGHRQLIVVQPLLLTGQIELFGVRIH